MNTVLSAMNLALTSIALLFTRRFSANKERGATAVEYGLLVALIAVVIIAGVTLVGNKLLALFNKVAGNL